MDFCNDLKNGSNTPVSGKIFFASNTHQRYEKGIPVMGEQVNCKRTVILQKNISGKEGYTVSIDPSMSAKPMKIISVADNWVRLQGYGYDERALLMGIPMNVASFACYAITIWFEEYKIVRCRLHMLDRNVEIEYYNK